MATNGGPLLQNCVSANKDLWYTYPATRNGNATATDCGLITSTDTDTVIVIYAGTGCPSTAQIACNNDACGHESTVNWPIVCGQNYTIRVASRSIGYNITGSFMITETGTQCGPTGVPYCSGDGTGAACPCGNNGATGNGCANSVNANGANLTTSGNASLANDSVLLQGSNMPNSSCLYFQGTTQVGGGAGSVFGDGLRCAGGSVVRLHTATNVAGTSQYPQAGNPSVSVRGMVTAPGSRTYQVWYRNAAAFCTPSTFNFTNGVSITWQ